MSSRGRDPRLLSVSGPTVGLGRLRGRDAELELLLRGVDELRRGRGGVTVIRLMPVDDGMVKYGCPLTTFTLKFPVTSESAGPIKVRLVGEIVNCCGPTDPVTVSVTGTVTVPLTGAVATMVNVPW